MVAFLLVVHSTLIRAAAMFSIETEYMCVPFGPLVNYVIYRCCFWLDISKLK